MFSGDIAHDDTNKEKKILIAIEPLRPILHSSYLCDNRFHTDSLKDTLMIDEKKFGFIIVDGKGALYGTLQGNQRQVLAKFDVDLPRKHGRGGQSSNRFANLREESRHNYLRKLSEVAVKCFIENDRCNVHGIVLGGSADLKNQLAESDLFDPRLQVKIVKFVDLSYGDEAGFTQAINLASDCLQNIKYIQEKELIGQFFKHLAKDTGLCCYGAKQTMKALEIGAVESLIVWEGLDLYRYTIKQQQDTNSSNSSAQIIHLKPEQFIAKCGGKKIDVIEQVSLLDWLVDNYKGFGTKLNIVTDKSDEGSQFAKGFGGLGGILRYKLDNYILMDDDDAIASEFNEDSNEDELLLNEDFSDY